MYVLNLMYLLQGGFDFSLLYLAWVIELKLAPVLVG